MTITFFSNYLNHHQLPFCLELVNRKDIDFKFVATEKISDERIKLGYSDMNNLYDFVVRSYDDEQKAFELADISDVVIIGSASQKYILSRLKKNKLTFRYSEHIFKSGFKLKVFLSLIKKYYIVEKNVFLLCSSAYAADDFNKAFSFKNRTLKWGYFPKTYEYDIDKLLNKKRNNKNIQILWVGRFLDWKHPEKAVYVAKKLKDSKINFLLNMIGIGSEYERIRNLVKEYQLEKNVKLIGSVKSDDVRKYMEKANILLFTSDYNEGWGAVLNEAMNSGCAVIASHSIGSVPFLIKNNYNGIIFENDNIDDLICKVEKIVLDKEKQYELGLNAYNTIIKTWNSKIAVNNLLYFINHLKDGDSSIPKNGPCSIAVPISNKKMYKFIMGKKDDKEDI